MPFTHGSVGWAAFCFPSPRPSPLGRGRILPRVQAMPATEFANPVCAKHAPGGGCSLSPRERDEGKRRVRSPPTVAYPSDSSVWSNWAHPAANATGLWRPRCSCLFLHRLSEFVTWRMWARFEWGASDTAPVTARLRPAVELGI